MMGHQKRINNGQSYSGGGGWSKYGLSQWKLFFFYQIVQQIMDYETYETEATYDDMYDKGDNRQVFYCLDSKLFGWLLLSFQD